MGNSRKKGGDPVQLELHDQVCLRPRDRFWGSSPNGVGRLS
ncbi:hypothetical protein [Thiolapillus sp.]